MQIRLYTIPIFDGEKVLEEMNRFLRGNRVLEVQQEFVSTQQGAYWCFSVRYILGVKDSSFGAKKEKMDYKNILDEKTFGVFSLLRACRKDIAQEEAIPAFAVFTDAELASIAKLPEILAEKLQTIKGIGIKKTEKYGNRILEIYQAKLKNETSGQSDLPNSGTG